MSDDTPARGFELTAWAEAGMVRGDQVAVDVRHAAPQRPEQQAELALLVAGVIEYARTRGVLVREGGRVEITRMAPVQRPPARSAPTRRGRR